MKKIAVLLLAAGICALLGGCSEKSPESTSSEDKVNVVRTFIAGYELGDEDSEKQSSGRVLVNLMSNGTSEIFVGEIENGEHSTKKYNGTYSLSENDELDETISLNYSYGEGKTAEIKSAVIVDDIFEAQFYLFDKMTENKIKFYETSPAATNGQVYVGYKTKTGGMGAMVYAYSLCLNNDNTFDVSIMQMASVMHVWGKTSGTYKVNGESIEFTYDILTTDGEVVAENQISEGSSYTDTMLCTAFNIQQATMRATDAQFIRVN